MTLDSTYAIDGPATGEWLTLSHPVGADRHTWAPIIPLLAQRYRVLSVDTRGHGQSPARGERAGVDDLAQDLLDLWQSLGIARSHLVGLSLGGCVGLAVAHLKPERLGRLVIANARLEMDDAATAMWRQRAATALAQGMDPLVQPTLERWLTPAFRTAQPERTQAVRDTLRAISPQGFAACAQALADMHQSARLVELQLPTLLLTGRDDTAVPSALVHGYAALNPRLRCAEIDGPHLLHLEQPQAFTEAVLGFLATR